MVLHQKLDINMDYKKGIIMKEFEEFLNNIEIVDESSDNMVQIRPSHRTQFYMNMIGYAANITNSDSKIPCEPIIKVYEKVIDNSDGCSFETIMHFGYNENYIYIKCFYMEYNEKGVLTRSEQRFSVVVPIDKVRCINDIIRNSDSLNHYDALAYPQEGIGYFANTI